MTTRTYLRRETRSIPSLLVSANLEHETIDEDDFNIGIQPGYSARQTFVEG